MYRETPFAGRIKGAVGGVTDKITRPGDGTAIGFGRRAKFVLQNDGASIDTKYGGIRSSNEWEGLDIGHSVFGDQAAAGIYKLVVQFEAASTSGSGVKKPQVSVDDTRARPISAGGRKLKTYDGVILTKLQHFLGIDALPEQYLHTQAVSVNTSTVQNLVLQTMGA